MAHRRLTRGQSRDLTRLRLLAAGALIIANKSLSASVEDMAAHAGYTAALGPVFSAAMFD